VQTTPKFSRRALPLCAFTYASILLLFVSRGVRLFVGDSFMGPVMGREILAHGLPHEDTLTVMGAGMRWLDQQWLAHIFALEVQRIGGYDGTFAVRCLLFALTLAIAFSAALASAPIERVLLVAFAAETVILPFTAIRAQSLAEPLFAFVLVTLIRDARTPSRRVLLVVPALLLWANVHASVLLGVALVGLSRVAVVITRLRCSPPQRRGSWAECLGESALLVGAATTAAFLTPYGVGILHYYSSFGGIPLARFIREWDRVNFENAPQFFYVAIPALLVLARGYRALSWFEGLALLALGALPFWGVRHAILFGIALLMILPAAVEAALPPRFFRLDGARVNAALGAASLVALLATVLVVGSRLEARFQAVWPDAAARATAESVGVDGLVFADEFHGDWLLWSAPALEGRVSIDSRLLVTLEQMLQTQAVLAGERKEALAFVQRYSAIVFSREDHPELDRMLAEDPGWISLWRGERTTVYRRTN
jgi:hypothetical protein